MTIEEMRRGIAENMAYAGCDEDTIRRYLRLQTNGETDESLRLLSQQRCKLLKTIHSHQKMLDALDYLIYQAKNSKEK